MPAQDIEALAGVDLSDFQAVLRKYFKPNWAFTSYATYSSHSNVIPLDDTIPQVTEGDQIMSVTFAPTNTTNRVKVEALVQFSAGAQRDAVAALFVNGAANAVAAVFDTVPASNYGVQSLLSYEYVPGTTSLQTFSVRVGPGAAGTVNVNGHSTTRLLGGVMACFLQAQEVFV